MFGSSAPSTRPPAGRTANDVHSDPLLHDLRRGERDAFVRYVELYRVPVYNFVWRLLHDGEDAASATEEVFTTAYRRILLHDGPVDLRAWTFGAAIDVCRERRGERDADRGAAGGLEADGRDVDGGLRSAAPSGAGGADRREPSDLGRRFAQALETVEFRHQAVLLLHDMNGLRPAEIATVFGVTEEAASALLFRAREEFRRAFEELSSHRRAATCRLAEQTAAGAVGRSLSDDELRRLDQHAGYCRHCRRTMKGWGAGAIGLALFLEDAPLSQALATTPVFGIAMPVAGAPSAVAQSGTFTRLLTQIGRSLTSRAAAYALAAACLAVAVGLGMQLSQRDRAFIVVPGMGPRVPLLIQPAPRVARPSINRSGQAVVTGTRSATGSPTSAGSYTAATGSTVVVVADVGPSSAGGRPMVGHAATVSAEEARAVTLKGDAKGEDKTPKDGHASAGPGHSGVGNNSHAEPAGTHHGKAAKPAKENGKQQGKKTKKEHAEKRQDDKKNNRNNRDH